MSSAVGDARQGTGRWLVIFAGVSLALHLAVLALGGRLSATGGRAPQRAMELVVVDVPKPPPPTPVAPLKEPVVKPRHRPVRVAVKERPAPPPPEKPVTPEPPPPVVVGLTLSSTTTAGGAAVPVGNTLQGKSTGPAHAPLESSGPAGPPFVPSYQVDALPAPLETIRADYPPEVRRDEVEGVVILSVRINERGEVAEVTVVKGLDPRLDALAVRTLKASRWKAAVVKGQPVATEIKYNFRFELTR